jgi:hypothetical protein
VRAKSGETIAVIAAEVGETAKALHRPMAHLKQTGRCRRSIAQKVSLRAGPNDGVHLSIRKEQRLSLVSRRGCVAPQLMAAER